MEKRSFTDSIAHFLLLLMAYNFNHKQKYNKYLSCTQGWINFSVGFRTENNSVRQAIIFKDGKASVFKDIPGFVDVTLIFNNDKILMEMLKVAPNEVLNLLLKSKMRTEGNLSYLNMFNFLISLIMGKKQKKMMEKQKEKNKKLLLKQETNSNPQLREEMANRRKVRLKAEKIDPNVKYLDDPYLSQYELEDFPRLKGFLDIHFNTIPEVCPERSKLLTDWFIQNGFENDNNAAPWISELRQAYAYKYLMENKKPLIRKNDLLAGTSTTKEIGVLLYPDTHATMLWGELNSLPNRSLNPYNITQETIDVLHHHVFPFWAKRNMREWVREKYHFPLGQQLDERFAVYFIWKSVALSHTIPDFPKILKLGTKGIITEIEKELEKTPESNKGKKDLLQAMMVCFYGMNAYTKNLAKQAETEAQSEQSQQRKMELIKLSSICSKVPEYPAKTLEEAVNAIWISWVCLHQENTNSALSLGRLDQWLQPYFEADLQKLMPMSNKNLNGSIKSANNTEDNSQKLLKKKQDYLYHAIELIGCLLMRCTDHLPTVPDIGNYLFGGSSSVQAITLGGITPDGEDAVNDMTYIFLKVTEMLGIRDPNINARYNKEKNSPVYLKRLCEVNLITAATPSMHNDVSIMNALDEFNYPIKDLRNWSTIGCVEPIITAKHIGHTTCMMMNMVAALEMALNNGRHPLMNWDVGPKTGNIENNDFKTFDDFFNAFTTQFKFLIDNSTEYNNMLAEAHSVIRPTPLLSALTDGCIQKGIDVTKGGALYNTSGPACIGLADITDSLMAIKKLVFEEKAITFQELKNAVDANFVDQQAIHSMVLKKIPLFGSGSEEALSIANRITKFAHDCYASHTNFRGGKYTVGFWSMSNHVAFGVLTGALPSGRLKGKPFTPGLTPEAHASRNLLDNIRDVARLDPKNMTNNIAFNVKIVPSSTDTHHQIVENMYSYVKTYMDLGGMQMQLNVVTSDMLRDAMFHPEYYQNLIVRISGYNAYFISLNKDMQMELIERAEYHI